MRRKSKNIKFERDNEVEEEQQGGGNAVTMLLAPQLADNTVFFIHFWHRTLYGEMVGGY